MRELAAFLLFFASISFAQSGFEDGNSVYEKCQSKYGSFDQGVLLGYVMGVHDDLDGVDVCLGKSVKAGQARDVVCKYLRDNPENRDDHGDYLVAQALTKAWPCKKP
ncbi:Rap1a/Tai family immunity protein [Methylorubrum rhodesianum]|uniref:Rap1a/Tai family immunity protein n=1 Tax=Methylorubrum rhodesianum TaxID=29427 RepID=UPI003D271D7A